MPAGDRTGPMGMGPMTGRGAGYCTGYYAPGYEAPGWAGAGFGRGFGPRWGRGGGRGGWQHRHWYHATGAPRWARFGFGPAWWPPAAWGYGPYEAAPAPEQEIEFLRQQAEWLKQQLDAIDHRIQELGQEA